MELIHLDNPSRYVFRCTFDEKEVAKTAKFRWNPDRREWWTDDKTKAAKLASFAVDATLKAELSSLNETALEARRAALEASKATDAAIQIPAPAGCDYLPYQKAGISFMSKRPNTLLGDEMGLGKTIQAIGLINYDPSIQTVCVICPATLKGNWAREMKKWLVRPFSIGIGASQECPATDIVIINYESVWEADKDAIAYNKTVSKKQHKPTAKLRHASLMREFDLLVVDECHRLKNPKAKRSEAIDKIAAKRRVYMTGTPIVNRPVELWPFLLRLDPKTWTYVNKQGEVRPRFYDFAKRFCNWAPGTGAPTGASNLGELQDILRTTILIRRLKAEVLTELPAKRRQVVELDANGATGVVTSGRERMDRLASEIDDLEAAVELAKAGDDENVYHEAVARLKAAKGIAFSELARVRHEEAVALLPKAIEFLKDATEDDPTHKIVVMGWHHDVLNGIADAFGDAAVRVNGETKLADRDAAVQRFQTDPSCQVFVGSITAAGVGITLTASSHVVFVEEDWVPGNITQAEDRVHRIGQRESCLIQHLVLNGSVAVKMIKVCIAKQEIADKALDLAVEDSPEEAQAPAPTSNYEASTKKAKREDIVREAVALPNDQIAAIHTALKMLAGVCNWASTFDGIGFNKIDAQIGHSLAESARLTAKQAALGKRIVRKYRRQLATTGIYGKIFNQEGHGNDEDARNAA